MNDRSVTDSKEANILEIIQLGATVLALVIKEERKDLLPELKRVLRYFGDDVLFKVSIWVPNFREFLALHNPNQSLFNQLKSETHWQDLLEQIEELCFLNPPAIEKVARFIANCWQGEVAEESWRMPVDWKYLPPEEAVEAYQKLFGSDLDGAKTIRRAEDAQPRQDSEGIPVWVKLTKLARIFGTSIDPLENNKEGHGAYIKTVEYLVKEVVRPTFAKAFQNPDHTVSAAPEHYFQHLWLTPAARKAWQKLEEESEDDFVMAPAGANTGSYYPGYSGRLTRLKIVLAKNQFPQDCGMVGSTLAIQPNRLANYGDLGIDCPGTRYAVSHWSREGSYDFSWGSNIFPVGNIRGGGASKFSGQASGFFE